MRVRQASRVRVAAILLVAVGVGSTVRADYVDEVLEDRPFAYWRLGEDDPLLPAENLGSELELLSGLYVGNVLVEGDGLLFDDPDTAVGLDGFDAAVHIPESTSISLGGPFEAKTIELWFQADVIDEEPRILYEEGGLLKGLNMYVQEVDGEALVFMAAWNRRLIRPIPVWDLSAASTAIEAGVTYHAVLVFDASDDDVFGDFDGRITGYLDGEEVDTLPGADRLYAHPGGVAIGAVAGWTRLADGNRKRGGGFFAGRIDEVALYDYLLDDPDDDGDRSDSRVLDHFLAGSNPTTACPTALTAAREGSGVKLTWTPGAETSVRVTRNGTVLAPAAPVASPQYVDTTATPGVLVYELTFDVPGDSCSLKRNFRGCIADLTAKSPQGKVELAWVNNFPYANIVVQRGDDVVATIGGDQVSYTDTDPPPGVWTYSVVPQNGDCDPATVDVHVFESDYPYAVIGDGAVAYWRLSETADTVAMNFGSVGPALDGTYTGNVLLGEDSLLVREPGDPAIALDGIDGQVNIPNSNFINIGGPFLARTIELWFQAELIDTAPRILWEEGGIADGLNMYVQEVDGDFLIFMVAWAEVSPLDRFRRQNGPTWGPTVVSAAIEEGRTYHAVMVFDASADEDIDTLDGRITGYLDGEEFETAEGAGPLDRHISNIAIGGISRATQFADGTEQGSGANFRGKIDEVSVYNIALDDPDDDGDFADSRVGDHFRAGSGGGTDRPQFRRGDPGNIGSVNISTAILILNFLFSDAVETLACEEAGDINNDGRINITDPVNLLNHLFGPQPPPAPPGLENCGPDPDASGAPGDLGCETYTTC